MFEKIKFMKIEVVGRQFQVPWRDDGIAVYGRDFSSHEEWRRVFIQEDDRTLYFGWLQDGTWGVSITRGDDQFNRKRAIDIVKGRIRSVKEDRECSFAGTFETEETYEKNVRSLLEEATVQLYYEALDGGVSFGCARAFKAAKELVGPVPETIEELTTTLPTLPTNTPLHPGMEFELPA